MRTLKFFPLMMDVFVVTGVFLLSLLVCIFRGRLCRLMFFRQNFRLFFDYDVVRCLVKGVLDRLRFIEGYPFSEFRLVPEHFSESVYGHFVAYAANP